MNVMCRTLGLQDSHFTASGSVGWIMDPVGIEAIVLSVWSFTCSPRVTAGFLRVQWFSPKNTSAKRNVCAKGLACPGLTSLLLSRGILTDLFLGGLFFVFVCLFVKVKPVLTS